MAEHDDSAGIPATDVSAMSDEMLAREIESLKNEAAAMRRRIEAGDEISEIIKTPGFVTALVASGYDPENFFGIFESIKPDQWPEFRDLLISVVDPSRLVDERLIRVLRAVSADEDRLPPRVKAAALDLAHKVVKRVRARSLGADPVAAAALAEAERAYCVLETEVDLHISRKAGNATSAQNRKKTAEERRTKIERLVAALPEHDRRTAPAALDALKRILDKPADSEGEALKRISEALGCEQGEALKLISEALGVKEGEALKLVRAALREVKGAAR